MWKVFPAVQGPQRIITPQFASQLWNLGASLSPPIVVAASQAMLSLTLFTAVFVRKPWETDGTVPAQQQKASKEQWILDFHSLGGHKQDFKWMLMLLCACRMRE